MHTRYLIPVLLLLSAPAAAQEVGVKPFNETPGRASVADFWQAVKGGETGRPSSSSVKADYLMHPPNPACADNRPCSEKLVGFALPVHATMSPPLVSVGTGPETGALAVLGGFAVLGLLGALRLLVRLGKPDAAEHHALGHGD
ncbi:hypothetical protein [Azospirillum sp. sgz301742]